MGTREKILKAVDKAAPPWYYVVSKDVEQGVVYLSYETESFPRCIFLHPDDLKELKKDWPWQRGRLLPLGESLPN